MNINKRLDKIEDVLTELQVFLNGEGILPSVHYFNDDVVKCEPEWLPCPNPECRCKRAVYIDVHTIDSLEGDYTYYFVLCDGCGYCGPEAKTPQEAIRLHNLISTKKRK